MIVLWPRLFRTCRVFLAGDQVHLVFVGAVPVFGFRASVLERTPHGPVHDRIVVDDGDDAAAVWFAFVDDACERLLVFFAYAGHGRVVVVEDDDGGAVFRGGAPVFPAAFVDVVVDPADLLVDAFGEVLHAVLVDDGVRVAGGVGLFLGVESDAGQGGGFEVSGPCVGVVGDDEDVDGSGGGGEASDVGYGFGGSSASGFAVDGGVHVWGEHQWLVSAGADVAVVAFAGGDGYGGDSFLMVHGRVPVLFLLPVVFRVGAAWLPVGLIPDGVVSCRRCGGLGF